MERAEKQGLAVAAVGHIALFVLLSLGLFSARIPKPPLADTMDVTIADTAGLQSAAPSVSKEAPKASEAPEQGKPEESAPPPPAPEKTPPPPEPKPPAPEPKPTPPRPSPPKPSPPKPEKAEPKPEKKAEPKPEKPKPEKPKPAKPKPEKPAPETPKPAKPVPEKPAKPAPEKTTEKSAAAKTTAKASTSKKAPGLPSDFLKDLPKDTGSGKTKGADKPKGSRLGKDFLKGLGSDAAGKADAPRAAAVSARSMAGLGALLLQQVKPCYNPPAGGADAGSIATVLNLRMNRDGSVASVNVGDQTGVNAQNQAYAKQMADAARRAVLRCAPFKLPAGLYDGGWDDFGFRFRPGA